MNKKNPQNVYFCECDEEESEFDIGFQIFLEYYDFKSKNQINKLQEETRKRICQAINNDFNENRRFVVFTDSRKNVELYCQTLIETKIDPNLHYEPHHSSIDNQKRIEVENILRDIQLNKIGETNFTRFGVISTNTLELGVDIEKMDAVGQIGPGFSVSSLRQRMGRSSHTPNSNPAIKMYITERVFDNSDHPLDRLRITSFQALATLLLLSDNSLEEPDEDHLHLSTLVHQTLSILRQRYSEKKEITENDLYEQLFINGQWDRNKISPNQYHELISTINWNSEPLLLFLDDNVKLNDQKIVIKGKEKQGKGLRFTNSPMFYSAFKTPPEYIIQNGLSIIGKIPMSYPYHPGETILFDGRKWIIKSISIPQKKIFVIPSLIAKAPRFGGEARTPSEIILNKMHMLYEEGDLERIIKDGKITIDQNSVSTLNQGLSSYQELSLKEKRIIPYGNDLLIFPWKNQKFLQTLTMLLKFLGLQITVSNISLIITNCTLQDLKTKLVDIDINKFDLDELARYVDVTDTEKFDYLLTPYFQRLAFSHKYLQKEGINEFIHQYILADQ